MKLTPERLETLNKGAIETANLMEGLAIDFTVLLHHTIPDFKMPDLPEKCGITKKMQLIGKALYHWKSDEIYDSLKSHPTDMLRGLACYVLANYKAPFKEKLDLIKPLADDSHFGVREWAWIALRPELLQNLDAALDILTDWTMHHSANCRRYASEITRPRGVWCAHIPQLKQNPWSALDLLSNLKSDPERYVQLSVGNWLNDAGKDHPQWVKKLCLEWENISPTAETKKICKRALRNLKKKGD